MTYLDVEGIGRVSRIGMGTWQFGWREWATGARFINGFRTGAIGIV
jgi:aryl-alcohol dehydrogenase-like predicted oxidoreductase